MISPRIQAFLDDWRVGYEVLPHREAFTAQGVAASLHLTGWRVAKVVVVHDDEAGEFLMAVLPASCHLDMAKLRLVADRPQLRLATEEEASGLFPDCIAGAIPPFGMLYGLPVFVDACFPHAQEVVFQAGNHHEVVRMPYAAFEKLAAPRVVEVCSR